MCGEHFIISARGLGKTGSSPHVRGAPNIRPLAGKGDGIIPACAGSTMTGLCCSRIGRDHPRMCGEHDRGEPAAIIQEGSSPHVRGAHHCGAGNCHCEGIIPACAGSTSRAFIRFSAVRDHPRMCGEHWGSHDLGRAGRGSSPHVRGARANRPLTPWRTGIIPACAGSTPCRRRSVLRLRDHPRMCGEHFAHSHRVR